MIFFFSSLMRLTLSNLYSSLKPKTLTFDLSLFALSWVLTFPLSLFISQISPLQAIPIRSFTQFKACFALSLSISAFFQVIYTISHRIWNFRLIWIQFMIFSSLTVSLFSPPIFSLNKNNAVYFNSFFVCVFKSVKLFVDLSKISMDFQCTRNLTRVL